MKTGTKVGAKRWPMWSCHPDGWGKPWAGVVLAKDDPRAWAGTLAFSGTPTAEQVRDHLARVGSIPSHTPVLWDFGDSGRKVYWERVDSLRPYADDVAEWKAERAEKKAERLGLRVVAA